MTKRRAQKAKPHCAEPRAHRCNAPRFGTLRRTSPIRDAPAQNRPATAGVPKVIGKSLSGAKGLLEKAGFVVGSTHYGSHDDFDSGQVISQKPPAGTLSPPGTKIDLTIND